MVTVAFAVVYLALAGAIVSWLVGSVYFARTLATLAADHRALRWLAILAWPFAVGRLKGAAAGYTGIVNKALVAFMACIMVLVAGISVATNLARIAK
jgi:hypothetical protein